MKWEQIQEEYKEKWVLLENVQVDADMNILEGKVIHCHADKDNIMRKLLKIRPKNFAMEYIGEISEDIAVML
jgi:hypothetical protein